MTELLKTEEIESRAYQEVISASALEENTLVVLPTGLGKTVIAAMVAARKAGEGKILFLAPTKPLVEQHFRTFRDFLDVDEEEMQIMSGETRPEERYRLWKEKRIFFSTPQVAENDLISQKIPVEDFSLAIFDEAHRATGDYSYVFINEKMPVHKLALTASPGGSKEKIMNVAENLDINNFEVRTEEDPDVEPYIQEREVTWAQVTLNDRFEEAKKNLDEAYRKQLKKLKELDQINSTSNVHKKELLKIRGKLGAKLSGNDDPKLYSAISRVATALKITQAVELLETQGVSQCYSYLQGLETDDSKAAKRALNNDKVQEAKSMIEYLKRKGEEHPKLEKLREILNGMEEDEKAIVFTEYRDSTDLIADELNNSGLHAVRFVGQQGDRGMTQNKQREILDAFDEDKYNVLVSTSIGEEGLDIPAVDYVIFYEPVPSGIRDIQRAGRTGRQESGKIYVLMAENTRDESYYWSAHHKKKNMNKVLNELKNEDIEHKNSGQRTLDKFKEGEEDQLVVMADDRENKILKELSKKNVKVRQERLEVADFIVSSRTAVERKKASDFVDSIVDQRLFEQLTDLQQFENPVLIIEGKDLYSHRNIHPNSIRGALSSIALDHGIPILWTNKREETAEMLESLAKREQEEKDQDVAIRGTRTGKTEKGLQEFIVAGIPDINTKLAKRLLEKFGSVEKIFTASKSELEDIQGIGDKTAKNIRSIIEKDYNE